MAKILIPTPLRQYTGGQDSVDVAGATIGATLGALTTQYPDLRKNLYTEEGKLRSFVNVYLNDEDIRYLSKDATPVKDSDTVTIVPSIAGGCTLVPCPPKKVLPPTPGGTKIVRRTQTTKDLFQAVTGLAARGRSLAGGSACPTWRALP